MVKAILKKRTKLEDITIPDFRQYPQSYGNQNNMVLAQKLMYGSLEQNIEPRNKLTHLQSINLQQRRQKYTMEKRQFGNKWCWEN